MTRFAIIGLVGVREIAVGRTSRMARGKGKAPAKQGSLRAAGLLPTLKNAREAIGLNAHVPGDFWDGCSAADKKKVYVCAIREYEAVHKFSGPEPTSWARLGHPGTGQGLRPQHVHCWAIA